MRHYEIHTIDTPHDGTLADEAGLLDNKPSECDACSTELSHPYSVRLGEDDFSTALCSDCLPVPFI